MSEKEHEAQKQEAHQMTTEQFLAKLFDKYDANSDSRLSTFQFAQILKFLTKALGVTLPNKEDLQSIFQFLDSDSDRTISKQEYKKFTKCLQPLIRQSGVKLLYKGIL